MGLFTLKPQMRKMMADDADWLMVLEKYRVTNSLLVTILSCDVNVFLHFKKIRQNYLSRVKCLFQNKVGIQ